MRRAQGGGPARGGGQAGQHGAELDQRGPVARTGRAEHARGVPAGRAVRGDDRAEHAVGPRLGRQLEAVEGRSGGGSDSDAGGGGGSAAEGTIEQQDSAGVPNAAAPTELPALPDFDRATLKAALPGPSLDAVLEGAEGRLTAVGTLAEPIALDVRLSLPRLAVLGAGSDGALEARVRELEQSATEKDQAAALLRESEERYALAMRGANDGLWDWNRMTDELHVSPRFKELAGLDIEGLTISPAQWQARMHPDDREHYLQDLYAHLAGRTEFLTTQYRVIGPGET